ncbi:AraC family transcriptional regulator [Oleiphilus messinensis]|uniref:AraC family transcriptional regulator n=1 Tax=Oleiphilus messinensis TaxID=141451 RepID=A0A1Y0I6L4_9GAMM|nr:AraC family transcriptional regulator [Oleiphilus messinensis]ARU55043.1 AraC family transcriptional regulator [Oleiphilus messinensis]
MTTIDRTVDGNGTLFTCASALKPLLGYALHKGCELEPLLHQYQLDSAWFDNPNQRISVQLASKLYQSVRSALDIPDIGLRVGKVMGSSSFSVLQHLLLSCPTLGESLTYLIRYYPLWSDEPAPVLVHKNGQAILRIFFQENSDHSRNEAIMRAYQVWFKLQNGRGFALDKVSFAHDITYKNTAAAAFECGIETGAEHYSLVFSEHWLSSASHVAAPAVTKALETEVTRTLDQLSPAPNAGQIQPVQSHYTERVRSLLREAELSGPVILDDIANQLNLSVRSLNRRLKAENQSFRQILLAEKLRQGKKLLIHSQESIEEIAYNLGYSSRRAFDRAFIESIGSSPSAFRKSAAFATSDIAD